MLEDSQSMLRNELTPGERLLWSGQPRQGVILQPADAFLIPFILIVHSCFYIAIYLTDGMGYFSVYPLFFSLFLLVMGIQTLYFLIGRFFVDAFLRAHTYYALTSERLIVINEAFRRSTRSVSLKKLSDPHLDNPKDGYGNITFEKIPYNFRWFYLLIPGGKQGELPELVMIENAQKVFALLKETSK